MSPASSAAPPETPALRFDGPDDASLRVALTHGAGSPVDDPFFETLVAHLAGAGLRMARFEFPYMERRRGDGKRRPPDREPVLRAAWKAALDALGGAEGWVIGGKSMGGRMASLVADEVAARGLVCLGYPFHPPGKPERLRTAHLAEIRTPTLILQGTRDPFGRPDEVAGYRLSPRVRVQWVEDGAHSLEPRKSSGRTLAQNLEQAARAIVAFVEAVGDA